jgi:hypothetical protein
MHNQMQPSGRMQGFGMQNADATGGSNMPSEQNSGLRGQTANNPYAGSTLSTNVAGTMQQAMPAASYASTSDSAVPGYGSQMTSGSSSSGLTSMNNTSATNTNTQQLSYDQFQEQVRQRQEQEQVMARQALLSAGADRQSDRTRAVLTQLSSLSQEIQRAENQIQVQMDAQLRQLQLIHQRVRQAENLIQETLPSLQTQNPASAAFRQ